MDTPKLKLTNLQLVKLANALASLDGIRLGPQQFEPFNFNPETTWKVANNIAVLADPVAVFERAKKMLMVQNQMADQIQVTAENAKKVADFIVMIEGLEAKEVEVALEPLSREKLNVGGDSRKSQNRIPPSVLAALVPILED